MNIRKLCFEAIMAELHGESQGFRKFLRSGFRKDGTKEDEERFEIAMGQLNKFLDTIVKCALQDENVLESSDGKSTAEAVINFIKEIEWTFPTFGIDINSVGNSGGSFSFKRIPIQ